MKRRVFAWTVIAAALCACEAVPEIAFPKPDASAADARGDASGDASGTEEGGSSCADGVTPAGATRCCGAVPCYGACSTGDCMKCEAQCVSASSACCTDVHPIICTTVGTACP